MNGGAIGGGKSLYIRWLGLGWGVVDKVMDLGVLIPWPGLRNRNCDRNSQKAHLV